MSIPGIPGASEPSFRTRDAHLVGLDALILETCGRLARAGMPMSPMVVKAAVQVAREILHALDEGPERDELVAQVTQRLRRRYVLLTPAHVSAVLENYGRLVLELDITEVTEFP